MFLSDTNIYVWHRPTHLAHVIAWFKLLYSVRHWATLFSVLFWQVTFPYNFFSHVSLKCVLRTVDLFHPLRTLCWFSLLKKSTLKFENWRIRAHLGGSQVCIYMYVAKFNVVYPFMEVIVIVMSRFLKRYLKAKRTRAPAYSRAPRRIKLGFSKKGSREAQVRF